MRVVWRIGTAGLPGIDRSSTADFEIKRKKFAWLEIQLDGKRMLRALLKM